MPAFDAAYALAPRPPLIASKLEILMMQPGGLGQQCTSSGHVRAALCTFRFLFDHPLACNLTAKHGAHEICVDYSFMLNVLSSEKQRVLRDAGRVHENIHDLLRLG